MCEKKSFLSFRTCGSLSTDALDACPSVCGLGCPRGGVTPGMIPEAAVRVVPRGPARHVPDACVLGTGGGHGGAHLLFTSTTVCGASNPHLPLCFDSTEAITAKRSSAGRSMLTCRPADAHGAGDHAARGPAPPPLPPSGDFGPGGSWVAVAAVRRRHAERWRPVRYSLPQFDENNLSLSARFGFGHSTTRHLSRCWCASIHTQAPWRRRRARGGGPGRRAPRLDALFRAATAPVCTF